MRRSEGRLLCDREVIEVLAGDPELLAIADAIQLTLGGEYRRRRRGRVVRVAVAGSVVCVAAVLALVQPWSGRSGSLVAEALAAIPGDGSVVHATVESTVPGVEIVDLRTGRVEGERVASELWFDPSRDLLHTVVRRQGAVVADVVTVPGRTIAATGPALGADPSLERAVIAFTTDYRAALASGDVRAVGEASGTSGPTLEVTTPLEREQVTLSPATLLPIEIRPLLSNGRPRREAVRILGFATQAATPAEFEFRPGSTRASAAAGAVRESTLISGSMAARALPGGALWAGERLSGLRLRRIARERLWRAPAGATGRTATDVGVKLVYGAPGRSSFVRIEQARRPEPAYGFQTGSVGGALAPGLIRLVRQVGSGGHVLWRGQLRQGGLYLTLTGSSRQLVLTTARSLRPI